MQLGMPGVFYQKVPLHFYDCDAFQRLKLSALLKYLSDTADIHYQTKGFGHDVLWEQDMAFLLAGESILISRLPQEAETLQIATWEHGVKGARYFRYFAVLDEQGETVITAETVWLLCNPSTRRILRPGSYDFHMTLHPEYQPELPPVAKLTRGMEMEPAGSRVVRYSDLDVNGHVYNATYADFACDMLDWQELQHQPAAFRINFDAEASYGEELQLFRAKRENAIYCAARKEDGTLCFEAELVGAQ